MELWQTSSLTVCAAVDAVVSLFISMYSSHECGIEISGFEVSGPVRWRSMYLLVREAPEPGIWKIEEDRNSVF